MELPVEVQTVPKETAEFQTKIEAIVISDQPSYDYANGLLKEAKQRINTILGKLEPKKKKAYEAYKEWNDLINELTDPLKQIETILKKKIGVYLQEQDRIRREAEEKARREAEEKRLKDAEVLQEQGLSEEADKMLDKNVRIKTSEVAPKIERGGSYTATKWHAEVIDKMALIKAVADGKVTMDYLLPNMSLLNQVATSFKESLKVPGVKAVSEVTVGVRV